jgi:putative Mg2+ transporter-C (MgtC) family protein
MEFSIEDLIKIGLALVGGGLIGLEREFRDKNAGFRTLIFISLGSAVFTILSARLAPDSDPNRIAANIVTGIGFLGAGAILREGLRITGLTTAATIWLVAALGMAIGAGQYSLAAILLIASTIVLWFFPYVEIAVDKIREEHLYEVLCSADLEKIDAIENEARRIGLRAHSGQHAKEGDHMRCSWVVYGTPKRHAKFMKYLFEDQDVKELRY